MTELPPQVSIGLVIWNGRQYLPACLKSVLAQKSINSEIIAIDNNSTDGSFEYLQTEFPQLKIIRNRVNRGFAGGHNQAIALSRGRFYLALNQDTVLEPDYLQVLISFLEKNPKAGSAQGKIKRLTNGEKTNNIDSLGLQLHTSGQVTDWGEVEEDQGQFSGILEIFGPSGTLPAYRKQALEATALIDSSSRKEYFDEDFFAYKEDIDLAFRLRLNGWSSFCLTDAVAFHNRSVRGEGAVARGNLAIANQRQAKSKFSRRLSFSNHHFVYLKNLPNLLRWRFWPQRTWYEIKMWGYALLKEPFLIPEMFKICRLWPKMMRKRRQIMSRRVITPEALARWFV